MLIDKHRGNCETRQPPLLTLQTQAYNLLMTVGCVLLMHPARSAEKHCIWKRKSAPTSKSPCRVKPCPWPYITSGSFCPTHLHVASKEPLRRGDEGIHPGCSVLTLVVIAHFNAKAFCNGPSPYDKGKGRVARFFFGRSHVAAL